MSELKKDLHKTLYNYDWVNNMEKILYRYLHRKLKIANPDKEFSEKLQEEVMDCCRKITIKRSRVLILMVSIMAEEKWLVDHDYELSRKDKSNMFVMKKIFIDMMDRMKKESNVIYSIFKRLEEIPINPNETIAKAIKYELKKTNQRYSGKSNPVDIFINNNIQYTPLLGYGTYLARKNVDIWHGIKELVPGIRILKDDPFSFSNNTWRDDKYDEEVELHEKLYPIIEYDYTNNRINHVEKRMTYLGITNEKIERDEAEKERKKAARKRLSLDKELAKRINVHNKWYNNTDPNIRYMPSGFSSFIEKYGDLDGSRFVLIVVSNRTTGCAKGYRSGYYHDNPKDPVAARLGADTMVFNNISEAKAFSHKLKDEGKILDVYYAIV